MLMQSDPITDAKPYIHLLPALPDAWPAGSISGIKARGGYELSISWKEGKLTSVAITAQQDGTLRLRCKDKLSAKGLIETAQHDGVYEYEIAVMAGKRVSVEGAGL